MQKIIFKLKVLVGNFKALQEKGQGLIEYGLIILLIAMLVFVTVGILGEQITEAFNQITNQIPSP